MLIYENEEFILEQIERNGRVCLKRKGKRSNIVNFIDQIDQVKKDGTKIIMPLDHHIVDMIGQKLRAGEAYHDVWVFYEGNDSEVELEALLDPNNKSESEHRYTSTGIKFWKHRDSMESYRDKTGKSVISTHISPEGKCNLRCGYCAVTYRKVFNSLSMDIIKDYVQKLKTRGLKACITTGGGEPLMYKYVNEYFEFLLNEGMEIGLITNGTQWHRLDPDIIKRFSWVRVSVNIFKDWEEKITVPLEHLGENTIVGMSMVYTSEHEATKDLPLLEQQNILQRVKVLADKYHVQYVRILPNCLLTQKNLLIQHKALGKAIEAVGDDRFFHQKKVHRAPNQCKCHQSFFRPYLSEEVWTETGIPGTVFPCDSIVLNEGVEHFDAKRFGLCSPDKILDYMDHKIPQRFDATKNCRGCVFSNNIDMLSAYIYKGEEQFDKYEKVDLLHENFI